MKRDVVPPELMVARSPEHVVAHYPHTLAGPHGQSRAELAQFCTPLTVQGDFSALPDALAACMASFEALNLGEQPRPRSLSAGDVLELGYGDRLPLQSARTPHPGWTRGALFVRLEPVGYRILWQEPPPR